ncbi:MAG: DUF192 domain-containing protein [Oscillatoriales cyanobacterium SM2_2_1]|nr:DUF192 domain-containing protein [Oscillatoriales cyanobacterium SM2_2_1]
MTIGIPKNCGISLPQFLSAVFCTTILLGAAATMATPVPDPNLAQFLPVEATAQIRGQTFELEVARTPTQKARGLMFRDALPKNRGMMFLFGTPQPLSFWMKNVPVPLDMIFLLDGEVRAIAKAIPCSADPCPIYPKGGVIADTVIELRGNRTQELGVQVGDRVTVRALNSRLTSPRNTLQKPKKNGNSLINRSN